MLFTDLIFVFAFLPIVTVISLFDRSAEYKNLVLILASEVFFSWGRPALILLLFATAFADYLFGLGAASENKPLRIISAAADLLMNLAVFVVFSRNWLFDKGNIFGKLEFLSFSEKLIPIGVGFYAFRGMSYVLDVFRKRSKPEKNPFCILTYMMDFHLMFAGPLVRYDEMRDQLRTRRVDWSDINDGISRFVLGLGKAALLAPAFSQLASVGMNFKDLTAAGAWLGIVGCFGSLWWAFAGYNDMALGLGLMNGFTYPENLLPLRLKGYVKGIATGFNSTLCRFFSQNTISQKNKPLNFLTVLLSSLLVGLWYVSELNFLAAAAFFGVFIGLENLFLKKFFDNKPPLMGNIYTILLSFAGASLLFFNSFDKLKQWLLALVGKTSFSDNSALFGVVRENWVLLAIGFAGALPLFTDLFGRLGKKLSSSGAGYASLRLVKTAATALILCCYTVSAYQLLK